MADPKNLGWDKVLDPQLYKFYAKKLPIPGWAGCKSPEEKRYTRSRKNKQQG